MRANTSQRRVWAVAGSLAVTAVLAFALGALTTAWVVARSGLAQAPADTVLSDAEPDPTQLHFPMVPPVRLTAGEAAVLLPEAFADSRLAGAEPLPRYTLQLGLFLRPEQAEAARGEAEAKGITATTRLSVDARGRAWYQVTAGSYADRVSAELAARSLRDAYPIDDGGSRG